MPEQKRSDYLHALENFQLAHWQAGLEHILARLRGESVDLLAYEEVRRQVHGKETSRRQLKDIPLDAIVGSVGRYTDFTRSFLPRRDSDRVRWAQVQVGMTGLVGLPPIEVYQIGEVYFVLDGNHRVSVARQQGAKRIEAYVTEVEAKVALTPDMQPDDLILAAEYADFLQRTRLDELRPATDLHLTLPGRYPVLFAQIEAHQRRLQAEGQSEIDEAAAAVSWYDSVYAHIAELIRRQDLLKDFPGRTPLDLYVWITKYQEELAATLGWEVAPDVAAAELARQRSPRLGRVAARVGEKLRDVLTPDALESGPSSGVWRWQRDAAPGDRRLFAQILVPVTGQEEHWFALYQALQIARREGGQVVGLHAVARQSDIETPAVHDLKAQFFDRCAKTGIPARFDVVAGPVARVICERGRFTDLTVIRLVHPPAPNPIARLGSGIRTMLHRCPGPLLITPRSWHVLAQPLLAYNGSDKAREALYVTAYLSRRWDLRPVVLAAAPDGADALLAEARAYLEGRGVEAEYVQSKRAVAGAVLAAAEAHGRDLIILGGYSRPPLGEAARDSTVNALLRASRVPLLICR